MDFLKVYYISAGQTSLVGQTSETRWNIFFYRGNNFFLTLEKPLKLLLFLQSKQTFIDGMAAEQSVNLY